jgi:hypothetical protein
MTRPLVLAALTALAASCTKPRIEPTAGGEQAPVAPARETASEPEPAAERQASPERSVAAAPSEAVASEPPAAPVSRGGWSVGISREDEEAAAAAQSADDAQQSDEDDAALRDDEGELAAAGAVVSEPRVNEYGAPIDSNGNPILTGTMADTATATAATGAAAGANVAMRNTRITRGRGDELPPVEDAQAYDEEAEVVARSAQGDAACGPGETAQGYDPVADETGLCVPRTLAEQCQRSGQLPVVVSDLGMDCAVPRQADDAGDEALAAAPPIELPSCDEESVIVLLPDGDDQGGGAFDCRLVAQLDQSTMRGLTGKACDEQAIVVKVYAGSSTDDAIKGDVSCL